MHPRHALAGLRINAVPDAAPAGRGTVHHGKHRDDALLKAAAVNLSIGQPDFDVPEPIKAAAHAAIDRGANGYTVTQGIPELRQDRRRRALRYHHDDREVFITSGTSGGLVLALSCTVNPGDEVIVFDPYFVMYPHLVTLAAGTTVNVDTYPDFGLDVDRVRAARRRAPRPSSSTALPTRPAASIRASRARPGETRPRPQHFAHQR